MVNPVSWRDLPWLYRMRRRMLILDSRRAYTNTPLSLQNILLSDLLIDNNSCTLVASSGGLRAQRIVGQFHHRGGHRHARLAFLGPEERLYGQEALGLLDELIRSSGERGAHMLIAEVDEKCAALDLLRRSGFAVYARQCIWKSGPEHGLTPAAPSLWRTAVPSDLAAMQVLYTHLVPPMVQQVEPKPFTNGQFWVHWKGQELLAILEVIRGPLGVRLQPYFHPAVRMIEDLLLQVLQQYLPLGNIPAYVCIRSYQGGFSAPLESLGFVPWSDQAVMVRRLTAAVAQRALKALPALEGTQAEPSAPMSRYTTQV